MKFAKAHGLGNDFILVDQRTEMLTDLPRTAKLLCDRRTGIGADGLVLLEESECCDIRMRIFNSDGSEADMCGNAVRCVARYCRENNIVSGDDITVQTNAGVMRPKLIMENGSLTGVRVDMGAPEFECEHIPMKGQGMCINQRVDSIPYPVTSLLMGVPHTVLFVPDAKDPSLLQLGAMIERHELWPKHTNVDFVTVVDQGAIVMRTYERGCGPTLACGTGACAAAVASCRNGKTGNRLTVQLELGELLIEYDEKQNRVFMTGPAAIVFTGEL